MRCEHARSDQWPHKHRGQDGGFERDGKHESFATKPARSHSHGGIIVNQAFRQTSEIAHGHASTHDGWQPFLQILSSTFLLAKTDDDATTRGFLRIEAEE
jgi:hypothetical protein